jgi:hypothetical protein
MISNAPFRDLKNSVAVPDVAVRVICEKPPIERKSKKQMKIDLIHKRFFFIIKRDRF